MESHDTISPAQVSNTTPRQVYHRISLSQGVKDIETTASSAVEFELNMILGPDELSVAD